MNKKEKKALYSFLAFYVITSTIFISIIAYMHYEKEYNVIQSHCSMKTSQTAWQIKSQILEKHITDKKFNFNTHDKYIHFALIGKNNNIIYSNLTHPIDFNLDTPAHNYTNKSVHVLKIKEQNIPISYVVVEDTSALNMLSKLKYGLIIFIALSLVAISFFGYILSKMLLSPIKKNFKQLNNFVKDSSHELNTPITALVMIVSKLKKNNSIDKKTLNQIIASVKSIKLSSDKLLFSANGEVMQRYDEAFNFKDIIEENIAFFDELAQNKNIILDAKLDDCEVYMDKYCANMLINNIISNAIKYTKKDKNISIILSKDKFCVKDEGIGINKDMKDKIFLRYQRGTDEDGGFGIGLDIVASICKEYDIQIKVNSAQDKGSEFSFNLSNILT